MAEGTHAGDMPSFQPVPSAEAKKRPNSSDGRDEPMRKMPVSKYTPRPRFEPVQFVSSGTSGGSGSGSGGGGGATTDEKENEKDRRRGEMNHHSVRPQHSSSYSSSGRSYGGSSSSSSSTYDRDRDRGSSYASDSWRNRDSGSGGSGGTAGLGYGGGGSSSSSSRSSGGTGFMSKMQQDYTARFDAHNSRQSDSSYRYNDGYGGGGGSSRNRGWGDSSSGRQGLGFGSGHQDRGSSRFSRACNSPARGMSFQQAAAAAANSQPTPVSATTLEEKQRLVESVAAAIATTSRDPSSLSGSDTPNYNFILSRSIQACRTNPEYIYVQLKDIPMDDLPKNRKVPTDGYACELRCQSVYLATGYSGSKNGARDRASEQAVKLFLQQVEARVVQRKYRHAPVNDIVVCAKHQPTPAMVPPLRNPEEKPPLSSKGIYEPDKSKHWTEFVVQDNAVDAICILNNSAAYNRMKIDYKFEPVANSNIFTCNVFVQDQFVASARGTKKTSKHAAAEEALKKLRQNQAAREQEQQQRQQQQEQQRQQLLQQQLQLQQQQQLQHHHHQPQFSQASYYSETVGGGGGGGVGGGGRFGQHGGRKKQLSELVILENSDNAICIINDTAQFNKVSAEYKFQVMPDHRWRCEVYLEGQYVAAGLGPKKTVKHIAAEEALATLRQTQAVVKSNLRKEGYADALSRNQILARSGEDAMQQEIKEDNIGNQLLRKMGWTGGGLGREGEGIAEPIRVKEQFTREGLGMDMSRGPGAQLTKRNIEEIIRNYAASDRNDDLRFSTELNNDERKQIHQVSQKYGLRSKSYGVGKQRFLIVSRKVHKDQLIGQLLQEGQVGRYELVKPQASH